jgi:hypothetical protein
MQDISEYLDFGFYDRIWFLENAGLGERKLGYWLGVSYRIGSLMASTMSSQALVKPCQEYPCSKSPARSRK